MTDTSIDYGNGLTNVDPANGIRYGVIGQHHVGEVWWDESIPEYGPFECLECGDEIEMEMDECPGCGADLTNEFDFVEPIGFSYEDDGYHAFSDDIGDIFLVLSPYYTLSQLCSPCAPGAGYLINPGDHKAYCFGHDWFEGGRAPHPVYSVETDVVV